MIEREDIDRVTGKVREAADKAEQKVRATDEYQRLRALPQRRQKLIAVGAVLAVVAIIAWAAL